MSIDVFLVGGCTLLVLDWWMHVVGIRGLHIKSRVSNKSCMGNGRTSRLFAVAMGNMVENHMSLHGEMIKKCVVL